MLECFGQWITNVTIQDKKITGRLVVLPMPPSENDRLVVNWSKAKEVVAGGYYKDLNTKTKRGAVTNSRLYKSWKSAAANLLKKGHFEPLSGEVACFVIEVFPDNKRRDADNRLKGLFDAMTESGRVFKDDCQIALSTIEKRVIKNKCFIVAFVLPRAELPRLWIEVKDEWLQQVAEKIEDEHSFAS